MDDVLIKTVGLFQIRIRDGVIHKITWKTVVITIIPYIILFSIFYSIGFIFNMSSNLLRDSAFVAFIPWCLIAFTFSNMGVGRNHIPSYELYIQGKSDAFGFQRGTSVQDKINILKSVKLLEPIARSYNERTRTLDQVVSDLRNGDEYVTSGCE